MLEKCRYMKYFQVLIYILLMSPLSVYSLGVGDLKTSSGLNEPFEAKINLISATPADLVSLKVFMADNDAFERAGIEKNYILSNLKFDVIQPEQGKDYIRVYSSTPIREPFLNFLVEVTWSSGRVFREFTVLLDPPLYDPNRQKLVKKPVPVSTKPSAPVIAAETGAVEGVVSGEAFENFAANNKDKVIVSEGDYGPIAQSESLWAIAAKRRPNDAVSVNQMMMAIFKANPDAFYNNNINGLKRGVILKMPSEAELASLTMAEANNVVKSQHQTWSGFPNESAKGNVPRRTETVSDAVSQQDSGTTSIDKKKTTPEKSGASLKLVSPNDGEAGSDQASDSGSAASADLSIAEETIEALSMENAELKDKLIETESIISDLNKLIEIQSDELNALRNQLAQIDPTIPEATSPTPPETVVEEEAAIEESEELVEEESQVISGTTSAADSDSTELPIEEVAEVEETIEEEISSEEVIEEEVEEVDVIDASAVSGGSGSILDTVMGYIDTAKGMATDLIGGSKEVIYGLVGLIVLLLLFVLNKFSGKSEKTLDEIQEEETKGSFINNLIAKFKKDDAGDDSDDAPEEEKESLKDKITYFIERITGRAEKPEEINFEQGSMISELAGDGDETEAPQADMLGESEEITDVPEEEAAADEIPEAVSADFDDFGGVEEAFEEDDSLQEVNTYLAFEQYDEAESFVRSAIEGQPNRPDYHLKLLEVFYTSGNKQAYEEEAKALNELVAGQGETWDSANAMWNEMSPNRGLFEAGGDDDDDTPATDTTGGGMLDLTAEADDVEGPSEAALDFDIAAPTEMSDEDPEEMLSAPDDDNSLDMDLPAEDEDDLMEATAAMDMSKVSESSGLELDSEAADDNSLDFDFTSASDPMAETAGEDVEDAIDHQAEISLDMPMSEPAAEEIPDALDDSQDDIATEVNESLDDVGLDLTMESEPEPEEEVSLDLPEESEAEEEISLDIGSDLSGTSDDLSLDIPDSLESEEPALEEEVSLDIDIEAEASDDNDDTSDLLNVTKSGHIDLEEEEQDLLDVTAAVVEMEGDDDELDLGLDDLSVPNETEEDLMKHISGTTESAGLESELDASDNVIDFDAATAAKESEDDVSLELDLEVSDTADEPELDVASETDDDEFSLDLEIGETEVSENSASESSSEEPVSEFSLDLDAVEEEPSSEFALDLSAEEDSATEMLAADEEVVDFDGTVEIPKLDPTPEIEIDDFDDEDEEDKTVFVPRSAPAASQSDEDENAAKLDLAKAYVELGDNDSARSILDEVVETGSEQQKQQASELLSQL